MLGNRGGHRKRITKEQREEILTALLNDGLDAAVTLARSWDLEDYYPQRLAQLRGLI